MNIYLKKWKLKLFSECKQGFELFYWFTSDSQYLCVGLNKVLLFDGQMQMFQMETTNHMNLPSENTSFNHDIQIGFCIVNVSQLFLRTKFLPLAENDYPSIVLKLLSLLIFVTLSVWHPSLSDWFIQTYFLLTLKQAKMQMQSIKSGLNISERYESTFVWKGLRRQRSRYALTVFFMFNYIKFISEASVWLASFLKLHIPFSSTYLCTIFYNHIVFFSMFLPLIVAECLFAGYIAYNFVIGAYSYWGPKAGYSIYNMVRLYFM